MFVLSFELLFVFSQCNEMFFKMFVLIVLLFILYNDDLIKYYYVYGITGFFRFFFVSFDLKK